MKHTFSPDVIALNPDLFKRQKQHMAHAQPTGSKLEIEFIQLWQWLGGPVLEKEVRFHPNRKWRFDFAVVSIQVAIEIEGYGHQKHNRYNGDIEKYNEAALMGWVVHRLTSRMITTDKLQEIIDYITQRHAASAASWAGVRE